MSENVSAKDSALIERFRKARYVIPVYGSFYFSYFALLVWIQRFNPSTGYLYVGIYQIIQVLLYIFMSYGCFRLYKKEHLRGWALMGIGAISWMPAQVILTIWTFSRHDPLVSAEDVGTFVIVATLFAVIGIIAVGLDGLNRRERIRLSLNVLSFGSCISFMGIVFISQLVVNGRKIDIDREWVNLSTFVIDVMLISFPLAIILYRRMDRNILALCFGMIIAATSDILFIVLHFENYRYLTGATRLSQLPALLFWIIASTQKSGKPTNKPTIKGENYLTIGVNVFVLFTIMFAAIKFPTLEVVPHAVSYSFLMMFVIVLVAQLVGHFENKRIQADQQLAIMRITQSEEKFQDLATHDTLTDLCNRTFFIDELKRALVERKGSDAQIAVLFIDLDRFKEINDTHGHNVGDDVIREIAQRIRTIVGNDGVVCRLGGDEFSVLIAPAVERDIIFDIASRILNVATQPLDIAGSVSYLSCSIGVAFSSGAQHDPQSLLRNADAAMYRAKELGRNRIEYADDFVKPVATKTGWSLSDLHRAIVQNEIKIFYQPIYDLKTNKVVAFEALSRWSHPTLGLISPDEFISVAEDNGRIIDIGNIVINQAYMQLSEWQKHFQPGESPLSMNINLSSRQLSDPYLLETIVSGCSRYRVSPKSVIFEMTESSLLGDARNAITTLNEIQSYGFRFHIDDFGTGYSSLSYLKKFPISGFKIDKSFVQGFRHEENDTAIVTALVGLGKSMDLVVTAEGIEDQATRDGLVELGCTLGQGYFYSEPLEATEIVLPKLDPSEIVDHAPRKTA